MNYTNHTLDITPAEVLQEEFKKILDHEYIQLLIDALPYWGVILNSKREVVFANKTLLKNLDISSIEALLGSRPGDFLGCIHSKKESGRCGSTSFCKTCIAINSIKESQLYQKQIITECKIMTNSEDKIHTYDFRVTASPFNFENHNYTVFSMVDIGPEKRRKNLERVFFHDIINKTDCLKGMVEMFKEETEPDVKAEYIDTIEMLNNSIIDELLTQRELLNAENGELIVEKTMVDGSSVFEKAVNFILHHEIAIDKNITVEMDLPQAEVMTDKTLLQRIFVNMLKNSFEAESVGATIYAGVLDFGTSYRFWVQNSSVIEESSKSQIFQRSFSTKSPNRGLGTYSIKLLGEKYLHGKVGFTSEPEDGTCFFIDLPK